MIRRAARIAGVLTLATLAATLTAALLTPVVFVGCLEVERWRRRVLVSVDLNRAARRHPWVPRG